MYKRLHKSLFICNPYLNIYSDPSRTLSFMRTVIVMITLARVIVITASSPGVLDHLIVMCRYSRTVCYLVILGRMSRSICFYNRMGDCVPIL